MATKSSATGRPSGDNKRWHAVSVKPCPGACPTAASGRVRRWLSREAPQLPLPGCTRPDTCRCTYQHHEDRRSGGRRAGEIDSFRPPVQIKTERRSNKDRRAQSDE
jgi:hypothetical protein